MGIYNILIINEKCPACGVEDTIKVQFKMGYLDLIEYQLNDKIVWAHGLALHRSPHQDRPERGNYIGEGYILCEFCDFEYLINITIENDIIKSYEIDLTRSPHGDYGEIPMDVLKRDFKK